MIITSEKYKSIKKNEKPFVFDDVYFYKEKMLNINENIFLSGEIDYTFTNKGKEEFFGDFKKIESLLVSNNSKDSGDIIEGSYIIVIQKNNYLRIFTDRYCKKDIFYYESGKDFIVSDSLECFFKINLADNFDQKALVSFFTVYGNYPPKRQTLYKNIRRIGLGQEVMISRDGLSITDKRFIPLNTKEYDRQNLDEYFDIFSESVKNSSTDNGINWIYLSSGWDSTAILGMLREFYSSEKIRGVIGEMVYSERSGVINKFEIDRAEAIAKYYGIKLDIVPLDYTKPKIIEGIGSVISFMKYNMVNSFNTLNFIILSDFIGKNSSHNDVVFSGEISDGVHNLGFSQYATILEHPDFGFREYADKMASYLFGPSFLKSIYDDNYEKDVIYNFFRQRYGTGNFFSVLNEKNETKNSELLASFFLSPRRVPFYSLENLPLLTEKARSEFLTTNKNEYFLELSENMNTSNIYSILIYLYNSFHWQGSTVKVIGKALERFGKSIKLPFWDSEIQNYLSQMPESWGRGLDFKKTKYPLKWILENKIDYPMHLQKGPHSYLYDVNPGFSHLAEVLYGKRLNDYFKNILSNKKFAQHLDWEYFDKEYLNGIYADYMKGTELSGQRLNDIGSLILFSLVL